MAKKIVLLGATGSIGTQALSLLKEDDSYELIGVSANKSAEKLIEIVKEFPSIKFVGIASKAKEKVLAEALPGVEILSGEAANLNIIDKADPDVVLNSILGFDGFLPSLHALKINKILLLANKETLVVGGKFINEVLEKGLGRLYPIDSEHVALAKCLADVSEGHEVQELFITASGGALRDFPMKEIANAPIKAVLQHPTWKMGAKITVDSATMVNKAYEVIEASVLFHRPLKEIKAYVERGSLIHGGVVLEDGSKVVEYSQNTMLIPLKYALSLGQEKRHVPTEEEASKISEIKLEEIDRGRYPMFYFIIELVGKYSSRGPVIVNAVDEIAVNAYLNGEIRYGDMETIIRKVSSHLAREASDPSSLRELVDLDKTARDEAQRMVNIYANALMNGNDPSDIVAKPIRKANEKHEQEVLSEEERQRKKKASRWKNDPTKKVLVKEHKRAKAKKEQEEKAAEKNKEDKPKKITKVQSFGEYMNERDSHEEKKNGRRRSNMSEGKKSYRSSDHSKSYGSRNNKKSEGGFHKEGKSDFKGRRSFHKNDDSSEKRSYSHKTGSDRRSYSHNGEGKGFDHKKSFGKKDYSDKRRGSFKSEGGRRPFRKDGDKKNFKGKGERKSFHKGHSERRSFDKKRSFNKGGHRTGKKD